MAGINPKTGKQATKFDYFAKERVELENAEIEGSLKREAVELKKARRKLRNRVKNTPYPSVFQVQPGQPGFNAYAQSLMQKAKVLAAGDDVRCVNAGDPPYDQPYQRTIAYLAHPKSSPDYRMLVAHRTGSGKTLGMIRVLSNFFNDPRPKVAIFPKEDVKINFYRSIMTFDNPYRDYVLKRTRMDPQTALANLDLVVKTLSMHGHPQRAGSPGYLAAPLRAFSYNEIGGSSLNQYRWFHPFTPCGTTDRGAQNRWCDKIVVMDEAHNLVKPTDESKFKLSVSKANLGHARDALRRATRTVLVLFTATPMIDDIEDIDAMLSIVKGHGNEELNDEGFVSAFYGAPVSSYPRVEPDEREIPRMIRVELTGDGDDKDTALGSYLTKLLNAKGQVQQSFMEKNTRDVYDYTPKYFSQQAQASFLASLRTEGARDIVPKLWAAAEYIESAEGKVIVLTAKRHGFFTLDALLRTNPRFASIGTRALLGSGISTNRSDWNASLRARSGATDQAILKAFNGADNVNGERLKALVLNADSYSEGVDFKDVRHVVLLDIAPKWATMLQRVGRAVRHCSHQRLPPEKRTVETVVMVASLPAYARFKSRVVDLRRVMTVDEQHIVKVIRDRAVIEKRMCDLMASAVDAPILSSAMAKGCGPVSDAVKVDYKPIIRLSPEETERLRKCVKTYERCVLDASKYLEVSAKDDWMSHGYKKAREEFMQRKMEHCKGFRNVCEEEIMGPEDERDFGRNCPPLYNQETCDYYCEHQLGLRGKDYDKCVRREHGGQSQYYYANAECPHNLPCSDNPEDTANRMAPGWGMPLAWISSWFTPGDSATPLGSPDTAQVGSARVQTSTSMAPCEVCPEGLSDEHCFEHCINSGLVHGDLYRCVARQQRAKCEHEFLEHQQKPEAKPASAAGSERLLNPSTGKMVKRGGATHKRLCDEGVIDDCTGVNTAAKRRKSGRRASSRKRSSGRRRRSSRPRSPTVPELKKRCKDAGITGYSKLRKADLMKKCL